MATVVIGTKLLQSENNGFPLRDASFSSYLNSTEYVKKSEDGEIDVFEAEKYFNGAIDVQRSKLFVNGPKDIEEIKPEYVQLNLPRVRFETPSIRSESSWNSSGLLLQRTLRNNNCYINDIHNPLPRTNKTNKSQIKNFISTLGCNCSCNGKNSVDIVDERTAARRSVQSSPMSSYLVQPKKSPTNPWLIGKVEDKIERKSLELFGSPVQRMIPIRSIVDDETCSDASSDLFEIESFATTNTNTNSNNYNRDGTNTPRDYAPSEASVDWSVVTASAADISVLSDFDDMRTMSFSSNVRKLAAGERNDRVHERRRSGILSGCKSYKAVRVAGDGYKGRKKMGSNSNGGRMVMQHESESNVPPTTRFGAEGKVAGFDQDLRNERLGFDDRFVSQSHSAHYSRILYA